MVNDPDDRPRLDDWLRRTLQSLPPLSDEQVHTISRVVTEFDRARSRRKPGPPVRPQADPEPETDSAEPDSGPRQLADRSAWLRGEIDAEIAMLRVAQAAGDERQISWHRGVLDGYTRAAAGLGAAERSELATYIADRLIDKG